MKKQILYIDNDIASYILVSQILNDCNIEITYCRDGLSAIKLFRLYPLFDLIITEIKLPRVSGCLDYEYTKGGIDISPKHGGYDYYNTSMFGTKPESSSNL